MTDGHDVLLSMARRLMNRISKCVRAVKRLVLAPASSKSDAMLLSVSLAQANAGAGSQDTSLPIIICVFAVFSGQLSVSFLKLSNNVCCIFRLFLLLIRHHGPWHFDGFSWP